MASQGRNSLSLIALAVAACATPAFAQTPQTASKAATQAQGLEFFEKKIRPVLVQQCYECHSKSAKSPKGGLLLDSRDATLKGGDSGAALVAGNTNDSLLIEAIRYEGLEMPPKAQLPADVIADFEKWVEMGAPDPRDGTGGLAKKQINFDEARQFWAYQPPKSPQLPTVRQADWPRDDLDRFILSGLEAKELHPVRDADRYTLLRRATFDLTGLPPTVEEMQAFVNDKSANAFEKVIDRLLASPQFGERWGRHWLDVARYAESTGKERNFTFPQAWRYRDYVIDSFNADKPYGRFITEQVAGDLLPAETAAQRNEQLVATGFLALGPKSLNERNREQYLMDQADEQIDVACRAVLATTVGCARCHDHKFDPIPTTDYYAMAGIFRSTDVLAGVGARRGQEYSGPLQPLMVSGASVPDQPKPTATVSDEDRIQQLESELEEIRDRAKKLKGKAKDKGKAKLVAQRAKFADRVKEIQQQLRELRSGDAQKSEAAKPADGAEMTIAVKDSANPSDCRVRIRGEVNDVGPEVPRGFVTVLSTASAPKINSEQSGRLELAAWLTSRDNPLTARVMVNRVWSHLFGTGLVETVDNFGALGERPSHPELLDHLAIRFMDQGWSVKQFIRSVMLSRTYRLSSDHDPAGYAADPANRLLWRMSRRRLDAEAIRDATLAASGQLDLTRPHASIVAELGFAEYGRKLKTNALSREVTYRSVYLPILRGGVPEMMNVFDIADPNLVVGQRDVTTVATQALYMLNSPFVMDQAEHAAKRLLSESAEDTARANLAYQLTLGRPATKPELAQALGYVNDYATALDSANKQNETARAGAWASLCQALLASAEFRYVY